MDKQLLPVTKLEFQELNISQQLITCSKSPIENTKKGSSKLTMKTPGRHHLRSFPHLHF